MKSTQVDARSVDTQPKSLNNDLAEFLKLFQKLKLNTSNKRPRYGLNRQLQQPQQRELLIPPKLTDFVIEQLMTGVLPVFDQVNSYTMQFSSKSGTPVNITVFINGIQHPIYSPGDESGTNSDSLDVSAPTSSDLPSRTIQHGNPSNDQITAGMPAGLFIRNGPLPTGQPRQAPRPETVGRVNVIRDILNIFHRSPPKLSRLLLDLPNTSTSINNLKVREAKGCIDVTDNGFNETMKRDAKPQDAPLVLPMPSETETSVRLEYSMVSEATASTKHPNISGHNHQKS
jgi:hypothetical protein